MLADDIAEGNYIIGGYTETPEDTIRACVRAATSNAVVVDANNVVAYREKFYERHPHGSMGRVSELPCIAPPFPTFILAATWSTKFQVKWVHVFWVLSPESIDIWSKARTSWAIPVSLDREDVGWLLNGAIFLKEGSTPPVLASLSMTLVAKNGVGLRSTINELTQNGGVQQAVKEIQFVSLLTLSFMHCKNVVQRVIGPPQKLSKRHKERHGRPLFSYRVLEIEPMKQVLRTEGRSDEVGLIKALHICRGHFKDYRERGLFGRNKGLYWWDHHVRGSAESGVAAKDYTVKAPSVTDGTKG